MGIGVGVSVGVGVGVIVGVYVGVGVMVGVAVAVGVLVAEAPPTMPQPVNAAQAQSEKTRNATNRCDRRGTRSV